MLAITYIVAGCVVSGYCFLSSYIPTTKLGIPVYPGATEVPPVETIGAVGETIMFYQCTADAGAVLSFYIQKMPESSWTYVGGFGTDVLLFEKGNTATAVSATQVGDTTNFIITYRSKESTPMMLLEIPKSLPTTDVQGADISDIPRYPGSIRASYFRHPNVKALITYLSDASLAAIENFYRNEMPDNRWEYDGTSWGSGSDGSVTYQIVHIWFKKGEMSATIIGTVAENKDWPTEINVFVTGPST